MEWLERSIDLANDEEYLDRLQSEIYDIQPAGDRDLPEDAVKEARSAYQGDNYKKLVKSFLKFDKFPYSDTYAAYLRHAKEDVFENNPETIKRIGKRIDKMGLDTALARSSRPKEANRQMGSKFEKWVENLSYETVSKEEMHKQTPEKGEILCMKNSSKKMLEYVNDVLNINITKEPDLVVKKGVSDTDTVHVVGEAKFLTDFGGHQDRQLYDALEMARSIENADGKTRGIAIVDGVHLIRIRDNFNRKPQRKIRDADVPVLSALLLQEFLQSL